MNNIHERRLSGLRNQVPAEVMGVLIGVSMMAMGFTGFHGGVAGARRRIINLIMAATIALLIMLVVDLDRPSRGLTVVPVQPLIEAIRGIPP
jgi:predicted lipid-binding transport protein (Tim44 family)